MPGVSEQVTTVGKRAGSVHRGLWGVVSDMPQTRPTDGGGSWGPDSLSLCWHWLRAAPRGAAGPHSVQAERSLQVTAAGTRGRTPQARVEGHRWLYLNKE